MKKTDATVANICFKILSIGQGKVTIQVTQVSQNSDGRLIGAIFVVSSSFPYSKVQNDNRGFYGLDYTVIRSMVFDEDDLNTEFNARVDVDGDNNLKLLGVTHAHLMFNVLKDRHKHHQNRPINSMATALRHASALSSEGGTSDGGTAKDVDGVTDLRTSRRCRTSAPRPPSKKKNTVVA